LLRVDGSAKELTTPGIALGVLEEITLHHAVIEMQPGDLLVCYTDGVTESFDEHGEQFGVARLIEVARLHRHESADAIIEAINAALHRFSLGVIYDDVTMVVIRRESLSA
jgi:serine phosphatase RsbU (regulator of sigma subunit)